MIVLVIACNVACQSAPTQPQSVRNETNNTGSSNLDESKAKNTLTRFVGEYPLVRRQTNNTGILGYVGPAILKGNEATVQFTIEYTANGQNQVESAAAIFNRTQDGRWILAKVTGSSWNAGWWTGSGALDWEVQ